MHNEKIFLSVMICTKKKKVYSEGTRPYNYCVSFNIFKLCQWFLIGSLARMILLFSSRNFDGHASVTHVYVYCTLYTMCVSSGSVPSVFFRSFHPKNSFPLLIKIFVFPPSYSTFFSLDFYKCLIGVALYID